MSVVLRGIAMLLIQVMLLLSVLLLLRGHNFPGGGFIGALIATAAMCLYLLTYSKLPKVMKKQANIIIAIGVLCILISTLPGIFLSGNLLDASWVVLDHTLIKIKLGTPLLFDLGIYLSILGSLTFILSILGRDDS